MNKIAKTVIYSLMTVLGVVSCEKKTALEGGEPDVTVSIKNSIDAASWSGKESIAFSANGEALVFAELEKGKTADIVLSFPPTQSDGVVYAVSPFDDEGEASFTSLNAESTTAVIPALQKTSASFCDPIAMLLFAKVPYTGGIGSLKSVELDHITAYAEVKVQNAPEPIEKVVAKFDCKSAGEFVFNHSSGIWSETSSSVDKVTVTANPDGKIVFSVVPVGVRNVEMELIGAATGAKYITNQTVDFTAGKVAQISVDLKSSLNLYIIGTAVGTEDPAQAKPLEKNPDGSFSYTGDLEENGWYSFIFDQEHLAPMFSMGDAFNQIKYSTKTTAAVFENKFAGNYTLTVYPSKAHLAVKRNFDHVIADASGADPIDENFDKEVEFVPYNPAEDWNWNLGVMGINAVGPVVYSDISVNKEYKLCGPNSLCLSVEDATNTDAGNGQIYRNGNNKQPIAELSKNYTVIVQMLYVGEEETKKIPIICEGALGAVYTVGQDGSFEFTGKWDTDMGVELQNGVPTLIQAQFVGNGAWGGCFNFYIRTAGTGGNYQLYIDGIQIGYDD